MYKYQEITQDIKRSIQNGSFPMGEKLPSIRNAAQTYGCAISVANQAYKELEMEGVIYAVEKSGFFPNSLLGDGLEVQSRYDSGTQAAQKIPMNSLVGQYVDLGQSPRQAPLTCGMAHPDLLPLESLRKCTNRMLRLFPNLLSSYAPSQGSLNLRKQIAKLMHQRGVSCKAEDVIVTNGCMEAIVLALRACVKPQSVVAVESPTFFGLMPNLREIGCRVIEIPTSAQKGMDLDILETLAKQKCMDICLTSATLQNPLGFSMADSDKKRLVEICQKNNITLIEDDVYGECLFDQSLSFPLKHYDDKQKVVYCSSFSKSTGAGLRIGWVIAEDFQEKIENLKMNETIGGPLLIQESLAHFIEEGHYQYHLKRFAKKLARSNYDYRQAILENFPKGTRVSQPKGGFFLWIELPGELNTEDYLSEAKVQGSPFVPGSIFSISRNGKNCLRINSGFPFSAEIEKSIQKLGKLFQKYI